MSYNAPTSNNFLKNSVGTDSSVIRGELVKVASETAEIRQLITSGAGYADELYIGDPTLAGSWKIAIFIDVDHSELKTYKKSADGDLAENWVQYGASPREAGELIRYNGSTPVTLTNQNEWYPSKGLSEGFCQEVEYVAGAGNDNYLLIEESHGGKYRVNWVTSMSGATGKTYEMGITVNGNIQTNSTSRKKMGANDVGPFVGTCLLQLNDNDEVRIATRCIDGAGQIATFVHSNINIARI